MTKIY